MVAGDTPLRLRVNESGMRVPPWRAQQHPHAAAARKASSLPAAEHLGQLTCRKDQGGSVIGCAATRSPPGPRIQKSSPRCVPVIGESKRGGDVEQRESVSTALRDDDLRRLDDGVCVDAQSGVVLSGTGLVGDAGDHTACVLVKLDEVVGHADMCHGAASSARRRWARRRGLCGHDVHHAEQVAVLRRCESCASSGRVSILRDLHSGREPTYVLDARGRRHPRLKALIDGRTMSVASGPPTTPLLIVTAVPYPWRRRTGKMLRPGRKRGSKPVMWLWEVPESAQGGGRRLIHGGQRGGAVKVFRNGWRCYERAPLRKVSAAMGRRTAVNQVAFAALGLWRARAPPRMCWRY